MMVLCKRVRVVFTRPSFERDFYEHQYQENAIGITITAENGIQRFYPWSSVDYVQKHSVMESEEVSSL